MIPRLHAPIVLAHGLFGFQRIQVGQLTVSAYFHGIPDRLSAAGNRVLAPQVPPIAGVELRARQLGQRIDAAFPGEPVHLIGHSMGGLDARLLASEPLWRNRILSVTTIGTPHLGSSLAEFAKARVGLVYRWLETLGIDSRGFVDVTPAAAREFNEKTGVHPSIACFSVAGDPAPEQISWPLRRFHAVLTGLEGPNDGLVSAESARAFGTPLPNWSLDHLAQVNWFFQSRGPTASVQPIDLYTAVL